MSRPHIGVLTTYEERIPEEVRQMAYELGRELARRGYIVITGGDGGLMRDVARGVVEAGGISVGVQKKKGGAFVVGGKRYSHEIIHRLRRFYRFLKFLTFYAQYFP